jgi:hypothetical protein
MPGVVAASLWFTIWKGMTMEFTKVGRYHLSMDDIVFVLDEGIGARISVGFRGGGTALLSDHESHALRVWLADKVKEELPLNKEANG